MKKRLLLIGLLATSLSMMAQEIFNFGFETPSSDLTVGKLEFVNFMAKDSMNDMSTLNAHSGTNSLWLKNTDSIAGSNYQRALKFRALPVEPNTSYRVSFWVKGNNTYTLAGATTTSTANIRARMSVGTENHDVPFVGAANTAFDYNFTGFDPANWVKKTAVFYYANDAAQNAYYKTLNPDSADLSNQYFLNLNVFNPGTYFIDDVSIVKSTIKGITYNADAIKVDFGYAINGDALRAGKDYATASLPIECVNVMNDGVKLDVEAVEIQSTGFYIFLATDYLDESAQGKLKIDFTNPTDPGSALLYTNNLHPNWETSTRVADFTAEEATFDAAMSGLSSSIYYPPFLKSSTPESGSFNLPYDTRSFSLVFSKKIDCSAVSATLAGPNASYALDLVETGYSSTLTFNVKAADVLSDMGEYFLSVKNISSEMGTPAENAVVSFEYGVATAGVIDTLYNSEKSWAANANGSIPQGFKRITKKNPVEVIEQNTSIGSNRMFTFPAGGEYTRGVYICYREGVKTDFIYGLYEDQRLHMKPGKYNLSVNVNNWNTDNKHQIPLSIMGMDTVEIFGKLLDAGKNLGNTAANAPTGSVINVLNFTITEENDYLMNFDAPQSSGWDGLIFGKIMLIKTPSTSFLYSSNLNLRLNAASNTLLSMDSTIYDGEAKTALSTVIQKYTAFSATSPSAYTNAVADIDSFNVQGAAYKAKVDAHFASIVSFHANVDAAKATLALYTGTKYEAIAAYPTLANVISIYEPQELTDDALLKVANDTLTFCNNLMKNWVSTAIPALTFRLNKAITLAQSLKVPVPEADLAAAKAALTDDDNIANTLNARIKQYLSHNLALDSIKFGNSFVDSTATDSLDMTCFIKNPNFYTGKIGNGLDNNAFPGWVSSKLAGAGIQDVATTVNPVRDTYVGCFNATVDTFYQVITGLPNGIYNVDFKCRTTYVTAGLTQADLNSFLKVYVIHGTDTTNVGFTQAGYGLPSVYVSVRDITVTDGTLTLGVKTSASPFTGYASTIFWGDPTIWMVGKAGTYTGVKQTAVEATVKEVQYYTIQGFRMNAPGRGLNIVRTIYDNGSVKVEKVMIR